LGYDYDYGNSSFFPDGPNRPVKGGHGMRMQQSAKAPH
jgi:hypothetical protein